MLLIIPLTSQIANVAKTQTPASYPSRQMPFPFDHLFSPLETLLGHLRLGGRNRRGRIGVRKAAALLAVLQRGGLG